MKALLRLAMTMGLLIVGPWAAGCGLPRFPCTEAPPLAQTIEVLAGCIGSTTSAEEAERLLAAWGRVGPQWGGVTAADLLPGGGDELVVRYHADLQQANWNPQGRLVVLQRHGASWRVAYDAATIRVEMANGTLWSNWRYEVLDVRDGTGDGLQDLLLELVYSNALHTSMSYAVVLSAHPQGDWIEMHPVFLQETTRTRAAFSWVSEDSRVHLRSVIRNTAGNPMIARTYAFSGISFTQEAEEIDPQFSSASATMSDGTAWYGFDTFDGVGGSPLYSPNLGLFRVRDGQLDHLPIPATVRVLAVGPDGALYVGAGCGVLRYTAEHWETLASIDCLQRKTEAPIFPFDLAFAPNGDLWVGGVYRLAHYDGKAWTTYDVPARRVLVAPDGTVWVEGWDGRANSDCCFAHLVGSTWVTYTHSATLPVSGALHEEIQALRR